MMDHLYTTAVMVEEAAKNNNLPSCEVGGGPTIISRIL